MFRELKAHILPLLPLVFAGVPFTARALKRVPLIQAALRPRGTLRSAPCKALFWSEDDQKKAAVLLSSQLPSGCFGLVVMFWGGFLKSKPIQARSKGHLLSPVVEIQVTHDNSEKIKYNDGMTSRELHQAPSGAVVFFWYSLFGLRTGVKHGFEAKWQDV